MLKYIFILSYFLIIGNAEPKHPIHLSVINFEFSEEKQKFLLSIRVFTDDFQSAINKELNKNLIINQTTISLNKKYIDKYIHSHFQVYFNNKKIFYNINSEKITIDDKENTTEIFYSFKHKLPKKVKVINTLFSGFFRDQKNLFIFTCKNTEEAFKFDRKNTESEFTLK